MEPPDGEESVFGLDVVQEAQADRPERLPRAQRRHQQKDRASTQVATPQPSEPAKLQEKRKWELNTDYSYKPIGFIESCFPNKNGTPRQPIIATHSRARLTVDFDVPNPQFAFEGLEAFSHVWLIFLFHDNKSSTLHLKVNPPRLEGVKMGLFATRTPHRPNPFGLSVAKLDKVDGNVLHLSGIDLINGTPVIDIKPYIPEYDSVPSALSPDWIRRPPRERMKALHWSPISEEHLRKLLPQLRFYDNVDDIQAAIEEVAREDPRSTHWKTGKYGDLYGFCIDILNVVLKFDDKTTTCTVIDVEDWSNGRKSGESDGLAASESAPAVMPAEFMHDRVRTGEVGAIHWALQAYPHAVNATDTLFRTPLHIAAALDHAEICKFLLEHGANPKARDMAENTPLLSAAREGRLAACQVLLESVADPNAVSSGNTALHFLVASNPPSGSTHTVLFTDVLRSFARKGANMNALDSNGLTPLHCALILHNLSAATALLQVSEVSVRPRTPDGETPYDIALRLQYTPICELLTRLGGHLVTERRASLPRSPSPERTSSLGAAPSLQRRPSAPVVKQDRDSLRKIEPMLVPIEPQSAPPTTTPLRSASPPRIDHAAGERSGGWSRALSPQRRFQEERREAEKRVAMLEQFLRQQDDMLREKEGQISLQEKHIAGPISPRERETCQRALADMHKQLAELRFAKFKTQKAIKNERMPTPRTDDNSSASSVSSSNPPSPSSSPITSVTPLPIATVVASPAATAPSGSPRIADRFRGAPLPDPPLHRAQTPPPTPAVIDTTTTWREMLIACGIDEAVAATYQRLWAHIAVPADKNQIPFAILKAFDGVKLGHIHRLMKHLGVAPAKMT